MNLSSSFPKERERDKDIAQNQIKQNQIRRETNQHVQKYTRRRVDVIPLALTSEDAKYTVRFVK